MLSSRNNAVKPLMVGLMGFATGFFFLHTMPFIDKNYLFLAALPLMLLVFLLMVINVKAVILMIILTRAFLDPILEATKVTVGGETAGLGAAINLSVIFLGAISVLQRPQPFLQT